MSAPDYHMDEQPAIEDPNLNIADVVVDSVDDRLVVSLMAEGDLPLPEARELADEIEAGIKDAVASYFHGGEGGGE